MHDFAFCILHDFAFCMILHFAWFCILHDFAWFLHACDNEHSCFELHYIKYILIDWLIDYQQLVHCVYTVKCSCRQQSPQSLQCKPAKCGYGLNYVTEPWNPQQLMSSSSMQILDMQTLDMQTLNMHTHIHPGSAQFASVAKLSLASLLEWQDVTVTKTALTVCDTLCSCFSPTREKISHGERKETKRVRLSALIWQKP